MIARLFPLKINFPTRLTVPWTRYTDDMPILIRLLRDRRFG
jgi:hypothetical protein